MQPRLTSYEEEQGKLFEVTEKEQKEMDEMYKQARPGDHLLVEFQCDLCQFRNLRQDDPQDGSERDQWLLVLIRRATLDAFWSRRTSTVMANLREGKKAMRLGLGLGIYQPLGTFKRGPCPVLDLNGMGAAVLLLERSLEPGNNSATVQFDTARGVRTFLAHAVHSSFGGVDGPTIADGKGKTYFSRSPTSSYWYGHFSNGCHGRMGDVKVRNHAVTMPQMLYLQEMLEQKWHSANRAGDSKALFECATLGALLVVGFGTAFRGEEFALCKLEATREQTTKGLAQRDEKRRHAAIGFRGRLKGLKGPPKDYVLPLAIKSDSGVQYEVWVLRLLGLYQIHGIGSGALFRKHWTAKNAASISQLDVLFREALKIMQNNRPDLLSPDVDVDIWYSVYRSLRRAAHTQAVNQDIPKATRELIARWNTVENAKNRDPSLAMPEHYVDLLAALVAFLVYSKRM